ncbi:Rrf2 family transcriptional regulator [soil metagenome]
MLSDTARYAIRAMVVLAKQEPRPASITEVATAAAAPRKYLESVMLRLKRDGLLVSQRGRVGGYGLARAAGAISVADIIRSMDGPLALAPCASRTRYAACKDCIDVEACRIRDVLLEGRDALAEVLERRTLKDLAATPSGDIPLVVGPLVLGPESQADGTGIAGIADDQA